MLVLTTFLTAVASALIPVVNIEIYLVGLATQVGTGRAVVLGLASGAGQTVGKIIWYELARRSWDNPRVQRKVTHARFRAAYDRWQARLEGRPWVGGAVMLCSAFTGFPPLLVLAMLAGTLKLPRWVFIPTVLLGRSVRFYLILVGATHLLDGGWLHHLLHRG